MDKLKIKNELFHQCLSYIENRIERDTEAISEIQKSINEETKSSMGDKYETARAMMHNEQNKYSIQIQESQKLRSFLISLEHETINDKIEAGSVVKTNIGNFYFAVNIGELKVSDELFKTLSLGSPFGKLLANHKANDEVKFNGKLILIEQIW